MKIDQTEFARVRLINSGGSKRHVASLGVAQLDDAQRTTLEVVRDIARTGGIAAMLGPRGGGKTLIAHMLAEAAIKSNWTTRYTTAAEMFTAIRESFDKAGPTEAEALRAYTGPALLIVDELHEAGRTDWERSTLAAVIDTRYRAMRATVLISNLKVADFAAHVGDSIASRITEHGETIICNWKSWRDRIPQAVADAQATALNRDVANLPAFNGGLARSEAAR